MAFVSTSTEIALIDARTTAGSITLPLTTQIQGRIITVKDAYGAADYSSITLQTQGTDLFEDGTVTRTIAQEYGNLTVFASTGRWFVTGGTVQNAFTINLATISTIGNFNWPSLNSNYNTTQVPSAIGRISLLDNVFTSTTAGTISSFIEFGNLNPLQAGTTGGNTFRYLVGVERGAAAADGLMFKIKRWNAFGAAVRPYGANASTLIDSLVIDNNGDVGIGTNSPATLLDVNGTSRSILVSSLNLIVSSIGIGRAPLFQLDVNNSARISTLMIGGPTATSTLTGTNGLLVIGNAGKTAGGNTWTTVSDQRIKENIVEADYSICYNDIKHINLRRFKYTSTFEEEGQILDKHVLGFIAQEVKAIQPKSVFETNAFGFKDLNTLNIDQMTMSLFGAVKKTILDKEALQSTTLSLQTLNDHLISRLSTLEGYVFSNRLGNL